MTAIGPCLLHEITNCSVCTGVDKKLAKEEKSFRPRIFARHPGKCSLCGETFDVGDSLELFSDGVWVCCAP